MTRNDMSGLPIRPRVVAKFALRKIRDGQWPLHAGFLKVPPCHALELH